jgi:hypothetical protein
MVELPPTREAAGGGATALFARLRRHAIRALAAGPQQPLLAIAGVPAQIFSPRDFFVPRKQRLTTGTRIAFATRPG